MRAPISEVTSNTPPPPREVKVLDLEKQELPNIQPGAEGLSPAKAREAISQLPEVKNELDQAPAGSKRSVLIENEAGEDRWHYLKCVEELENGIKQNFFRFRIHADNGEVQGYYKPDAEYLPLKEWRSKMNPVAKSTPE